jgi:hypothetical protein
MRGSHAGKRALEAFCGQFSQLRVSEHWYEMPADL